MNIKERDHYKLTREQLLQEFHEGEFQWSFELCDKIYTLYETLSLFILHEFEPPCNTVYMTEDFLEMLEYIYSKGEPLFFES